MSYSSQSKHFAEQIADAAANPSSTGLLYLLPPCLILLAVDVVYRMTAARQVQAQQQQIAHVSEDDEKISRLEAQARSVVLNFKQLDRRLKTEGANSRHLFRMLVKQRNFAHHRRRIAEHTSRQLAPTRSPKLAKANSSSSSKSDEPSAPFTNLCERILLQNKIWKQQKEIKSLQGSIGSMKASGASNAFKAFCDRLLLSNRIWKLQKEVNSLTDEAEKLKRSRVAAVTRAAKQMVQDVRKERLTEEFVKDLITEVEECRQAVVTLRAEHEREIQELAEEWRRDCRRLGKEVAQYKLAHDARKMEQALSNEMESELLGRLAAREQKAKDLEEQVASPVVQRTDVQLEDDLETLSGGSDLEEMSNMSTSTYVGSAGQCSPSPNAKFNFEESSAEKATSHKVRRSQLSLKMPRHQSSSSSLRHSIVLPPSTKTPIRKVDSTPYAGFSFNPLFFGNAHITRREDTADETESPAHSPFVLKSPPAQRRAGSLGMKGGVTKVPSLQHQTRVQWRV